MKTKFQVDLTSFYMKRMRVEIIYKKEGQNGVYYEIGRTIGI